MTNPNTQNFFLGTFPCDSPPPSFRNFPCCAVFNLDNKSEGGSHWVAVFCPSPRKVWYFDALGLGPNPCLLESLQRGLKFLVFSRNVYPFMKAISTVCGHYVVYFLYKCCLGWTLKEVVTHLAYRVTQPPDEYVKNFVKILASHHPSSIRGLFR